MAHPATLAAGTDGTHVNAFKQANPDNARSARAFKSELMLTEELGGNSRTTARADTIRTRCARKRIIGMATTVAY
jgi:hypothetical protein